MKNELIFMFSQLNEKDLMESNLYSDESYGNSLKNILIVMLLLLQY